MVQEGEYDTGRAELIAVAFFIVTIFIRSPIVEILDEYSLEINAIVLMLWGLLFGFIAERSKIIKFPTNFLHKYTTILIPVVFLVFALLSFASIGIWITTLESLVDLLNIMTCLIIPFLFGIGLKRYYIRKRVLLYENRPSEDVEG